MATTTIANMTLEELKRLIADAIEQAVDERLAKLLGASFGGTLVNEGVPDSRYVEEILDSIDRHMWTPPPGAKSSLELLREDMRDYQSKEK